MEEKKFFTRYKKGKKVSRPIKLAYIKKYSIKQESKKKGIPPRAYIRMVSTVLRAKQSDLLTKNETWEKARRSGIAPVINQAVMTALGLPKQAYQIGFSNYQIMSVVKNYQKAKINTKLAKSKTWVDIKNKGASQVYIHDLREILQIPDGVATGADPQTLLDSALVIQQVGGETNDPDWWNDFDITFRGHYRIPSDVMLGASTRDMLRALGHIMTVDGDRSDPKIWKDAELVNKDAWGKNGMAHFVNKWGTNMITGSTSGTTSSGTSPGTDTSPGTTSSGTSSGTDTSPGTTSSGTSSGTDTSPGTSGTTGLDTSTRTDSGTPTSGGDSPGSSSTPGTSNNNSTTPSSTSSSGGSESPSTSSPSDTDETTSTGPSTSGSTDSDSSSSGVYATITHDDDGSITVSAFKIDENGNRSEITGENGESSENYIDYDADGAWVGSIGGTMYGNKPDEGTYKAVPTEGGGWAITGNEDESNNGTDSTDGTDNNDDSDDSDSDDSDSDDSNSDDSDDDNNNDSDDSDTDDSEDSTPVDPTLAAERGSMSFERFMNAIFTQDGIFKKMAPVVDPVNDPAGHLGGGTVSFDRLRPHDPGVVDPVDPTSDSTSGTVSFDRLRPHDPGVVDPVDPTSDSSGGSVSSDRIRRYDPSVANTGTESGYGSSAFGGTVGSHGTMGPTEPWVCRRELIEDENRNMWCYCPVEYHPVTGEPINQWIPVPLTSGAEDEQTEDDNFNYLDISRPDPPPEDPCY